MDVNTPGTYTETYTNCRDGANRDADVVENVVRVLPETTGPNSRPKVFLDYANNTDLEVGTDPTATCVDDTDPDRPATRTGGAGFDVNDDSFSFTERSKPYTFTYTCTDTGNLSNVTTGRITQVSNVPHLAITAFDYGTDGKQTFTSVVDSFHRSGNSYTLEDARCYFHTSGQFQAPDGRVTVSDTSSIPTTAGRHEVTHTCTVDGKSNTLVHTVYTVAREKPVITVTPTSPTTHPEGTAFNHQSTCALAFGDDITPTYTIADSGGNAVSEIDASTAPGAYTVTYKCAQEFEATDHHAEGTVRADDAILVVNVASSTATTSLSGEPLSPAYLMNAESYQPGIDCRNSVSGGADLIKYYPELATLTADGTYDEVELYCPDGNGLTSGASNRTITIVVDNKDPPAPVVDASITLFVGSGSGSYDPGTQQDVDCPAVTDGSPLRTAKASFAIKLSGNIVSTLSTATASEDYTIEFECEDEAGNDSDPVVQTVSIVERPADAPTTTLTGKADKRVHIMTATVSEFETKQGIGCDNTVSGGPTEIFYIPEITSLAPNMQHTVKAYCPDGNGRVSDATNGTFTITIDNMNPTATISGSDPHVLKTVAGATYDSVDEGAICSDSPPGSVVSHTVKSASGSTSIATDTKFTATATCTDQAGNTGPVSWQVIVDGTRPAAPTAPATLRLDTGATVPDLNTNRPACASDSGSRVITPASFVIKLDGVEVASISTATASTGYTIEYTCKDAAENESLPAVRSVEIRDPASDTDPMIMIVDNNTKFVVGEDPPDATCNDMEDGTLTPVRTDPAGYDINEDSFGFAVGSRAIEYRFDYTCTDSDGRTDTKYGIYTQVSDVPHLAITGINYGADGKQTFESLTFHRSGNLPSFDDAKCYFHTSGEFQAPHGNIKITGEDDEGVSKNNVMSTELLDSIRLNLGWHLLTHTCTVDGNSNSISQTIYTTARDNPVINTGPAVTHALGDPFEDPATCTSILDEAIDMADPTVVNEAMTSVDPIDADTPLGTYTATYSCTQTIPENDNHLEGTITAAQKTLVINVIERTKPLLNVPTTRIIHEFGTALDLAANGVTCTDMEDGAPELTHDPMITATTSLGTRDVTIRCEDDSGNFMERVVKVVTTDMQVPIVTLLGDPVITSEGHLFRDPGASCEDPQDGRLDIMTTILRPGQTGTHVISDPGRYVIEYGCTDSDSNVSEPVTRDVYIGRVGDDLAPVISINGFSTTRIMAGDAYLDRGAVCTDANYGELPVVVREDVNTARIGLHEVTYTCTDGTFTTTAVRTVEVLASVETDFTDPVIETDGPFSDYASEVTGSMQTAGPIGVLPPPSQATAGATGIIDQSGNATFVPAPGPGGAASSHDTERLPHREGTEFVPPILWCVDGTNSQNEPIRTASNSTHNITPSTTAGPQDVTYTCRDAAGNEATNVVLRVEIEEEEAPPAATLRGPRTVSLTPGQMYVEEGARCDDGRFERPDRQLLPVIQPGSDSPTEFSKPGRYEISYACAAGGTTSGIVSRTIVVKSGSTSEEDWQLNPTFGLSWLDNTQAVRGGFSFDGRYVDVTDNFHAQFARTDAAVGVEHAVTAKIYLERTLERFILHLGVPDVSRATDSEADILVDVFPDSASETGYVLTGVSHEQDHPLVDEDHTRAELASVECRPGSEVMCVEVRLWFRVMAPLSSDILAISAMDSERRVTVTYVNDGVTFTGEQLFPPAEASFVTRAGNQHPAEWVHLVQPDRRYNVWEDQDGFAWLQNQYGSWVRLTHGEFERLADPEVSIVTRHHDSFADLLRAEQARAALVFDASELEREVGESFSHDAPVRVERLKDPAILERLRVSELAALEYLGR
ncbi:hypothetical protein IBTHAUMO2_620022 [Nitrosopumilaceae archaeon]|nr:hypothetical protein IBTHAUMO2_620022 [Nitrosopumilaceae archaeon]